MNTLRGALTWVFVKVFVFLIVVVITVVDLPLPTVIVLVSSGELFSGLLSLPPSGLFSWLVSGLLAGELVLGASTHLVQTVIVLVIVLVEVV